VQQVQRRSPAIPFISNVTGSWITGEQATDPVYWAQHLRQTVRFSQGIAHLLEKYDGVFLEVGPERTLSTLTTQQLQGQSKQPVLTSLRHVKEHQSDVRFLLHTLGRLWLAGVEVNWPGFYRHERRYRVPLPTYPFERQRYWIEPPSPSSSSLNRESATLDKPLPEQTASPHLNSSSQYSRPTLGNAYVAPTNDLEKQVTEIWQEILGITEVGIYDNFYELGGDSVIATQLIARLQTKLPVELSLRDMLSQAMVPAKQAEMIEELLLEKVKELSDEEAAALLQNL
jgi:acyl transferase domain-containing protein